MYPGDACTNVGVQDDENFVTISGLTRQLVTCLAGGEDPIDWEVSYPTHYGKQYSFDDAVYD